jgi:hypothetical protein
MEARADCIHAIKKAGGDSTLEARVFSIIKWLVFYVVPVYKTFFAWSTETNGYSTCPI